MSKRNIYTALAILVAICLPILGWMLTKELLIKNEEASFLETGVLEVNRSSEGILNPEENGSTMLYKPPRKSMTNEEIQKILENWESVEAEVLHEPIGEQIKIEQAIEIGEKWLSDLDETGILPEGLFQKDYDSIGARLFAKPEENVVTMREKENSSYWEVTFVNKEISVVLTINAIQGQVWGANIKCYLEEVNFNTVEIMRILDYFMESLNFYVEGTTLMEFQDESFASTNHESDLYSAVASKSGFMMTDIRVSEAKSSSWSELYIYLSASSIVKNE